MINSGIYAVDLKGTNDAEFKGTHPSLIMQSIKNKEMYYVIPLTTYSKDKWNKLRKLLCCRIVSINSIARIDKIKIIHKDKIPKRWMEGETLLVPTPNEILTVYNRLLEYIELSIKKSMDGYNKFYENYDKLYNLFTDLITAPSIEMLKIFTIDIKGNFLLISFPLKYIDNISFEDAKRIIWSILGKDKTTVTFDKNLNMLLVNVHKDKNAILTLKEWYDNMNSTEEHK